MRYLLATLGLCPWVCTFSLAQQYTSGQPYSAHFSHRLAQIAAPERAPARHVIGLAQDANENVKIGRANGSISVVVRDAALSDVLSALAESENLNLVVAAPANNRISVTLSQPGVEGALDALVATGGLTWTNRGGVYYVTSMAGDGSIAPDVQGRKLAVFELDYASAADVDQAVKGLLSPAGKSWINQSSPTDNRRTKEIITVEDLPPYLARIETFIAQADMPPRQVLIEVHVLQIDLSDDNRHGVDLSHVAHLGGLTLDFHTTGLANPNAPQAMFLQATAPNLTGLIEALKTTTDAKTLASPRIIAINGQESRIQVGEQLGFRVTTTTETSTLESVEFLDVGVVLTVTPRISRDGRVLMRIRPEVSSGNVNPVTGLPEEETTEVQTDVLLSTGQGMVIGGLIQESDDISTNKYLGLGDAPLLGPLFQRRQATKTRTEIIVALVPHILPLPPAEQYRNDFDVCRVRDPLFHGPLCRFPRPYEPRLPDCRINPRRLCEADPCEYSQCELRPMGSGGCIAQPSIRLPAIEEPSFQHGPHCPETNESIEYIVPPLPENGTSLRYPDNESHRSNVGIARGTPVRRLPRIAAEGQGARY